MKRITMLLGARILLICSMVFALAPSETEGAVPKLINTQGVLRDGSGNPVPDASYSMTFRIYDAAVGGTVLWTETQSVATISGQFNLNLGLVTPIPDSVFKDTLRWLGTTVSPDPEMNPRQQLVSVGYAYRVNSVDGALGGTITSKVSIGPGHTITGSDAFVAGNSNTVIGGDYATISGGLNDTACGSNTTVGGGLRNRAGNCATGFATVAGGVDNKAMEQAATVGGGRSNRALAVNATVCGGFENMASGGSATVGGGGSNEASGNNAAVGGGYQNFAIGFAATVPGGNANTALGDYSFAAGRGATANHSGTFVWGDSSIPLFFESTAPNQFLIRASGGVGIGTNSPTSLAGGQVLHVNNAGGPAVLRLGDDAAGGIQWELQSTVIGSGALNITNVDSFTNPLTLLANGNVGIGTTTPAARLHVAGTAGNNTGVWSTLSDRRLKKDVEPIRNALETVEQLQPVSFRWKDAQKDAQFGRVRGLIAQDVEKVLPEWIKTDPDGYKRIEPIGVDALLIEAVKEQQKTIEDLRSEVGELKELVEKLLSSERKSVIQPASLEVGLQK